MSGSRWPTPTAGHQLFYVSIPVDDVNDEAAADRLMASIERELRLVFHNNRVTVERGHDVDRPTEWSETIEINGRPLTLRFPLQS